MNAKRGKRREAARSIAKQSVAQRTHAPHTRHTPVHNTCARTCHMCRAQSWRFCLEVHPRTYCRCSYRMAVLLWCAPSRMLLCLASEQRYAAFLWGSARGVRGFLDGLRLPPCITKPSWGGSSATSRREASGTTEGKYATAVLYSS